MDCKLAQETSFFGVLLYWPKAETRRSRDLDPPRGLPCLSDAYRVRHSSVLRDPVFELEYICSFLFAGVLAVNTPPSHPSHSVIRFIAQFSECIR